MAFLYLGNEIVEVKFDSKGIKCVIVAKSKVAKSNLQNWGLGATATALKCSCTITHDVKNRHNYNYTSCHQTKWLKVTSDITLGSTIKMTSLLRPN